MTQTALTMEFQSSLANMYPPKRYPKVEVCVKRNSVQPKMYSVLQCYRVGVLGKLCLRHWIHLGPEFAEAGSRALPRNLVCTPASCTQLLSH